MVCPDDHYLDAYVDLFNLLVTRAILVCVEFWKTRNEIESTYHKILIKMINGNKISRDYINTQLSLTDIPTAKRFRVLIFRLDAKAPSTMHRLASSAANNLNDGHCYPFIYDDELLVLCFSSTNNDAGVSLQSIMKSTYDTMYVPFKMTAAISQPFTNIKDINFAYKQTAIAIKMRRMLIKAYPQGYNGTGEYPGLPFEYALQFLMTSGQADRDLVEFSFCNNLLDTIVKEDEESGT